MQSNYLNTPYWGRIDENFMLTFRKGSCETLREQHSHLRWSSLGRKARHVPISSFLNFVPRLVQNLAFFAVVL